LSTKELGVSLLDLVLLQFTVTVGVHGSENLIDLLFLSLGKQLGGDESVCGLLELGGGIEVLKIG